MSIVFPARAGMSPPPIPPQSLPESVPRASGDEPGYHVRKGEKGMCSPRERG